MAGNCPAVLPPKRPRGCVAGRFEIGLAMPSARNSPSPARRATKSPAKERPTSSPARSPSVAMGTSPRNRRVSTPGGGSRWTPAEQARLRALALEYSDEKDRWATIAAALGTGRSAAAVQQHYLKYCRRDMEDMASPEPTPPPPPPVNRQFVRTSKKASVDDRGTGGVASTATAAFASTVYFFAGPSLIFLNEQACTRHAHATRTPRTRHARAMPHAHTWKTGSSTLGSAATPRAAASCWKDGLLHRWVDTDTWLINGRSCFHAFAAARLAGLLAGLWVGL